MRCRGRENGVALIIVLATLVIIAVTITAFFSQSILSSQVAFTSSGQYQAEMIANTGLETVIADFQLEMAAGSINPAANLLVPKSNRMAAPFRVPSQGHPNVVKTSIGDEPFWDPNGYDPSITPPTRSASGNSTVNPAKNGRAINPIRWNAPYLLGTSLPQSLTPPDWILVTRAGPVRTGTHSLPAIANNLPTNGQYAIGRYAYIVYNTGGLLDANLTGFPASVVNRKPTFKTQKNNPQQIDISDLPSVQDADAFAQWRNAGSQSDLENKVIASATAGHTQVLAGDQAFISRHDLIKYVSKNPGVIGLGSLEFLTTTSHDQNTPFVIPDPNRAKVIAPHPAVGRDDDFNPKLSEILVQQEFQRKSDGTTAKVGEPLIKNRFALAHLALMTPTAVATQASDIYHYFGLQRAGAGEAWVYNHGASDRILRLSEVAALNREPDFFELLQAGILLGSLGKNIGDGFSAVSALDQNNYYQIIQIGANIIDQYDSDSYPTRISFNGEAFAGIEDLPYLSSIWETIYRMPVGAGNPYPNTYYVGAWYQPELWNPHAPSTSTAGPSQLRYIVRGRAQAMVGGMGGGTAGPTFGLETVLPNSNGLQFANNPAFREPQPLTPANSSADPNSRDYVPSQEFVGIWVGDVEARDRWYHGYEEGFSYTSGMVQPVGPEYVTHVLEYRDVTGSWVQYDSIRKVTMGAHATNNTQDGFFQPLRATYSTRSDPRTDRFGIGASAQAPVFGAGLTLRNDHGLGSEIWELGTAPGWTLHTYNGKTAMYPGLLADNKPGSASRYTDPDGVLRRADGAYNGSSDEGYPMMTGNNPSRPIILNRPFESVAELGYASRGMPWKHLDFFTTESADAALLDLFTVNPMPTTVAGNVDLNTRQAPVLAALLSNSKLAEDNTNTLSWTDATAIANAIVDTTKDPTKGPFLNRSDLVTKLMPELSGVPAANKIIKRQREAAVRTLADLGTTRTWTFMVDIIAQSGRYSKSATSLDDFLVQGERRYWMHVTIDRVTGKVLYKQIEPSDE